MAEASLTILDRCVFLWRSTECSGFTELHKYVLLLDSNSFRDVKWWLVKMKHPHTLQNIDRIQWSLMETAAQVTTTSYEWWVTCGHLGTTASTTKAQSSSSHWFCTDRTSIHTQTSYRQTVSTWVQTSKTPRSSSINILQQQHHLHFTSHRVTMTPCCLHLHRHIRWKDSILFYICCFILHTFTQNTSGQVWKRTHQNRLNCQDKT